MITFQKFQLNNFSDCLIVTDSKVSRLYGINGGNVYCLPQGEASKRFAEAEKLCEWFLSNNLQREGRVVAVGGGSVGDAAAFACSVYKRGGVKLTHVPTTLVAQIDSSIGGKTALDVANVKNAVGSFYKADTLIDFDFLKTLDDEQLLNGKGELTKYRMISPAVNAVPQVNTEEVIKACVQYKSRLCDVDPYDKNERRILNFGHTIGHGLELIFNLPHGLAVANGLYYETLIAYKLGKCDEAYFNEWSAEIKNGFKLYPVADAVFDALLNDKKNADGKICFVLPSDFSQVFLTKEQVKSLLC